MWMSEARLRTPWVMMRLTTCTIGALSSTSNASSAVPGEVVDVGQLEGLDGGLGLR